MFIFFKKEIRNNLVCIWVSIDCCIEYVYIAKKNASFRKLIVYYIMVKSTLYQNNIWIHFIMHLFYVSRQITLTGYIFVIYCHWPKYISIFLAPMSRVTLSFGNLVIKPPVHSWQNISKGAIKECLYLLFNSKYKC
jgi:hypothetical protein